MNPEPLRPIPEPIAHLLDEGERLRRAGQLDKAQILLEKALARAAQRGSLAGLLGARQLLGNLAHHRGDLASAREHHLFVLAECEQLGLAVGVASALHNLGLVAASAGDIVTARHQLLAAARRYERLGMAAAAHVRANLERIERGGAPPGAGQHGHQ